MPQQLTTAVENNFTKGLITESTGLNFPENAATSTDNCLYTLVGDVTRRLGIDAEIGFTTAAIDRTNRAMSSYVWNNAGGDGLSKLLVEQVGTVLYFYAINGNTPALSNQKLTSTVDISVFTAVGATLDIANECQFSDGNGYLFVYHPNCEPFYCSFVLGAVAGTAITVQIRDFLGIPESTDVNFRPPTLSAEHKYNLTNQGWTQGNPWSATTSAFFVGLGAQTVNVGAGIVGIIGGTLVQIQYQGPPVFINNVGFVSPGFLLGTGTVTSYIGANLGLNITSTNQYPGVVGAAFGPCSITPISTGYITSWFNSIGNYPSNADVWWYFKTAAGAFDPNVSVNVSLATGSAPKGHYILNAFNQQKSLASGLVVTDIVTVKRPSTGAWFQGRVWYAGVDDAQAPQGDAPFYPWTENIYFSQIVAGATDFGNCYQTNDPTSELLFDLLPTDGGVIQIQGCGKVYKLFPIQNGMLVFASNGIWFITGSQGIGFSANDYTITKLSNIQSISGSSFVDVMGLPYFWNQEGIYTVQPSKNGGLEVNPITVGTILGFYNNIPYGSKVHVKGAYNPIDYVIQWVYRIEVETDVTSRYSYDALLNFNVYNKAFYPYSIDNTNSSINGINYISYPNISAGTPDPGFKYYMSTPSAGTFNLTFADEHDEDYIDWFSTVSKNYESFFITGYKLRGQAIKKFQPQYIQMYTRTDGTPSSYKIQGIWDFANDRNSGRWSSVQMVNNALTRFDTTYRRHKIRGHGYALQFKITSVDGMPFDIQGWAVVDTVNTGT